MKLKNKKTGEIHEITEVVFLHDMDKKFVIYSQTEGHNYAYKNLAELNEEWEDYKEPKGYWYYDTTSGRVEKLNHNEDKEIDSSIGNCFETKEEAEKALEKLKAWKQLKDNCNFRFNGLERDKSGRLTGVRVEFDKTQVTFDTAKRCYEILYLLFGGEE